VIAVGPGRALDSGELVPCGVTPGERVVITKVAGTEVAIEGARYRVVRAEEIEGVLEERP
jgi:chaperonin GroES